MCVERAEIQSHFRTRLVVLAARKNQLHARAWGCTDAGERAALHRELEAIERELREALYLKKYFLEHADEFRQLAQ